MKKKIIAIILSIATLLSIIPFANAIANTGESDTNGIINYGAVIGNTAEFDNYFPVPISDKPETVKNPWSTDCEFISEGDVAEDLLLALADYYLAADGSLWYKVKAAPGHTLPEKLQNYPWVYQDNVKTPLGASLILHEGGKNFIFDADGKVITSAEIELYDTLTMTCKSSLAGSVTYQWQILVGDEWVDVLGSKKVTVEVDFSLLYSALDKDNKAQLRCVTKSGSKSVVGDAITVTVDTNFDYDNYVHPAEPQEPEQPQVKLRSGISSRAIKAVPAPLADENVCYVTIQYLFENGTQAANSFVAQVPLNVESSIDTTFPTVQGYLPYYNGVRQDTFLLTKTFTGDEVYTVEYKPTSVDYTVDIYFQNVTNDDYTFYSSQTLQGLTGSNVPENTLKFDGMHELLHETPPIAADGTTHIEIYYDRIYYITRVYLMGGYGIYSVYARYGADLQSHLSAPQRPGYSFVGWDEYKVDSEGETVPDSGDGIADTVHPTVPNKNLAYVALWTANPTSPVNIVFWGQDPNNDNEYSYLATEQINVKPDSELTYALSNSYICGLDEHTHNNSCTFKCGKTEHAHGDGNCNCSIVGHIHDIGDCSCNTALCNSHTRDHYSFSGCTVDDKSLTVYNATQYTTIDGLIVYVSRNSSWQYNYYFYINNRYYKITNYDWDNITVTLKCHSEHTSKCCTISTHSHDDSCCDITPHSHVGTCYDCVEHTHTNATCSYPLFDDYDAKHWELAPADQQETVTVSRDGNTVLNVYFNLKPYTLRFYYAATTGTGSDTDADGAADTFDSVKIIGGSTYSFGASGTNTSNDATLLDNIFGSDQAGKVTKLPQLNTTGKARNYTKGTLASNGTSYHYIEFTAVYGQDISNLWPCAVFESATRTSANTHGNWNKLEAFVSAWNGEHHVYYSQHNGNQTIKGKYEKLDDQLLFDPNFTHEYEISFLCFWENGANINWSVPELYVYNIWVPVVDGEDLSGLTTKTVDGITYKLIDSYNTCDDSSPSGQTQPSLIGYTIKGRDHDTITLTAEQSALYKEGYAMHFYYTRETNVLDFFSGQENVRTENIGYNQSLTSYSSYIPPTPSNVEEGSHKFAGWYLNPESTRPADLATMTMPANNLALYAKWVPEYHDVRLVREKKEDGNYTVDDSLLIVEETTKEKIEVLHGTIVFSGNDDKTPPIPQNGQYKFIGWFYEDDGVELMWDFEHQPVVKDTVIYAKWSSEVLVPYTIYYKDTNGNDIAAPTTSSSVAGHSVTVEAKVGKDLYAGYQTGYFPQASSHSIALDINDANNGVEYTFVYEAAVSKEYWIHYINKATGEEMSGSPIHKTSTYAIVTETFKYYDGYVPNEYQQSLILSSDSNKNHIYFYYEVSVDEGVWFVGYYIQNIDSDNADDPDQYRTLRATGDIGTVDDIIAAETPPATELNPDGFTFYKATISDGDKTETVYSIDKAKGAITKKGLEIKVYYTRNKYPYKVVYRDKDTGKLLREVKYNKDDKSDWEHYGKTITEPLPRPDFDGYEFYSASVDTIMADDPDNITRNIIYVYLTEQTFKITFHIVGPDGCGALDTTTASVKASDPGATCTATPAPGYRFVGWYPTEACQSLITTNPMLVLARPDSGWQPEDYYAKFEAAVSDLTIKRENATDDSQVYVYKVENTETGEVIYVTVVGNGQVTIKDLLLGNYTVTQQNSWSWRNNDSAQSVEHSNADGTTVTFNGNSSDKWLNGNSTVKTNKWGQSS